MSFPHVVDMTYQEAFAQGTTKKHPLGTVGMTPDGSKYRYCKAGAAIAKNWGCINANRHLSACTGESAEAALSGAIAVGDTEFTFLDTSTIAADYYADGYVVTLQTPFELHRIKSSTAGAGTSVTCTLADGDAFATADADGNTVNVYPSPWGNVKLGGAAAADQEGFVCVPKMAITSGNYFWGLVNGPCWLTVYGTWPLAAARDIQVAFWQDGSIMPVDECYYAQKSNQLAGHVIVSGNYGDCLIMLQIE